MPDLGPFIVAGVSLGAAYALGGMTLVLLFRSTGVLNLAHGGLGALSALVAWDLNVERGVQVWIAVVVGVLCATAVAIAYGLIIAPRLATEPAVTQAAATVGLALVIFGAADFGWGDQPRSLRLPTDTWATELAGVRVTGTRIILFVLVAAIAIGLEFFLRRSRIGLRMRALADDRQVGAMLGVSVRKTDATAWLIAGLLGGLSGIIFGSISRLEAAPLTFLVIPAVAAAVGGRLRSLPAALAAGLVMGVLESVLTPFDGVASYRSTAPFVLAIAAVLVFSRAAQPGARVDL